jgi:hypothetical protein
LLYRWKAMACSWWVGSSGPGVAAAGVAMVRVLVSCSATVRLTD